MAGGVILVDTGDTQVTDTTTMPTMVAEEALVTVTEATSTGATTPATVKTQLLLTEEVATLGIPLIILSTEEIMAKITTIPILLTEEIVALIQTILPILLQEPAEKAAITTQLITTLQEQEAIVIPLLAPILQVLPVEVCDLQEEE